jgi:hypothetical protein
MGDVYGNLGLYSRAESLLARALDAQRQVLGPPVILIHQVVGIVPPSIM